MTFVADIPVPNLSDGIVKDLRWAEGPMAGPKSAFLIIEWAIKSRRRLIINLQWVYDHW